MSKSNLVVASSFSFEKNHDTGSLLVKDLPKEFRNHGMKPATGTLAIKVTGDTEPRLVTYIMGSDKKGYSVCCKGAGQFPKDGEAELFVLPE